MSKLFKELTETCKVIFDDDDFAYFKCNDVEESLLTLDTSMSSDKNNTVGYIRNDITGKLIIFSRHKKITLFDEIVESNDLSNEIINTIKLAEDVAYQQALDDVKDLISKIR